MINQDKDWKTNKVRPVAFGFACKRKLSEYIR